LDHSAADEVIVAIGPPKICLGLLPFRILPSACANFRQRTKKELGGREQIRYILVKFTAKPVGSGPEMPRTFAFSFANFARPCQKERPQ
jgi:hypothetical protein